MMKKLWLFNPENDIALGRDVANFTAPAAAVALRRAGEMLPLWIADDGDEVMCSGVNNRWLTDMQQAFGLCVEPWSHGFDCAPEPWGWSKATRRFFEQNGFNADALPSDAKLDAIRRLSHRRTSALVVLKLREMLNFPIWEAAVEVADVEELRKIISDGGRYVIKSPWSSSGRGITFVDESNLQNALRQAEGTMRRQGSVMVERAAERRADFAMLFYYSASECVFCGYSLFEADARGAYTGNIVAEQDVLFVRLAKIVEAERLKALEKALPEVLREVLADDYCGPVGVDMLVADDGMLHPVVEVNLRWTMGFVALRLARFVDGEAQFGVRQGDCTAMCMPNVENGKLVGGTLALTPPGGDFTFVLRKV